MLFCVFWQNTQGRLFFGKRAKNYHLNDNFEFLVLMQIPYVLLKTAMSLDGCIDDSSATRRVFSSPEDQAQVMELRAECDAVLVGAGTLRSDNPRLTLRNQALRRRRINNGKSGDPIKVTLSNSGNLDPKLLFFTTGDSEKIVYVPERVFPELSRELPDGAAVVACEGDVVDPLLLLQDLRTRGIEKIMIEGGSEIIRLFLKSGLVSEIRLGLAPFFILSGDAPRFLPRRELALHWQAFQLKSVETLGQTVVMRYLCSEVINK